MKREVGRLSGTVLVLTGLQRAYCAADGALARGGLDSGRLRAVFPSVAELLAGARRSGAPVIHLREMSLANGRSDSPAWRAHRQHAGAELPISADDPTGFEFVADFAPRSDELVVERYRPGGLRDTRADVLLRSAGVRTVIVAGVETHRSVLATALQAAELDYRVLVPRDAIAATLPDAHDAGLRLLDSWVELTSVADLVALLAAAAESESPANGRPAGR